MQQDDERKRFPRRCLLRHEEMVAALVPLELKSIPLEDGLRAQGGSE